MCGLAAAALQAGGVVSVVRPDPRTGRLVRTVAPAEPRASSSGRALAAPPAPLKEAVDRIAQQNQLPASLVHSVISVESNYDTNAVSPKGALGLMQLVPATAKRFGVSDVFNPEDNVQGGARYLKYLLGLYKGDQSLALAAYNAGEGAVSRYGGVPPYAETRDYVAKVKQRLGSAGKTKETGSAARAVQSNDEKQPETPPAEVFNRIREVRDAHGKFSYTSTSR